jgi:hypothetical protein
VEEANQTFGTDSVAEDVEYGFAGEVGTTPPMDIDDPGISCRIAWRRRAKACPASKSIADLARGALGRSAASRKVQSGPGRYAVLDGGPG